jgi:hypothetical protein
MRRPLPHHAEEDPSFPPDPPSISSPVRWGSWLGQEPEREGCGKGVEVEGAVLDKATLKQLVRRGGAGYGRPERLVWRGREARWKERRRSDVVGRDASGPTCKPTYMSNNW